MSISKYLLCSLGILLALPILALTTLTFFLPISISGIGYLFASLLVVFGLIMTPWMPRLHVLLTLSGVIALLVIAGVRIFIGEQNVNVRMIMLPRGKEANWVSYIIDEQDNLIFGEALFHFVGGVSSTEHKGITQALYTDYSEMRETQGTFPSPFVNTYLSFQHPISFDAVIIEPEINRHPEIGVIFLHGFMGNVTAQCWEIAQAVSRVGAVTVCPSTGWRGEWWQPEGEAILRSTFDYLRKQGVQKFYLGGFSNGSFGISRLVSKLGDEAGLSGLFFIDGIYNGTGIREIDLPILIIQGTQDERMPASEARQIAEAIGDSGTYVELDSDHFLIMKQPDAVQDALANWLEDH
jgi:pimeloyl-ACP methyl ester carboxylesterase